MSKLSDEIAAIPFEDHHVHAPTRLDGPVSLAEFRRQFTDASIPAVWRQQLQSHLGYRWMVRELAGLLNVEPDEAAVLAARNAVPFETYQRLLADAANLGSCYADDLYPPLAYGVEEWSKMLGRPVRRVLRIEVFVEQCCATCETLDEALEMLSQAIRLASEKDIVALKSIAGYRSGLAINPPSPDQRKQASAAYGWLRERLLAGDLARIESGDLVDTIVWTAMEAASESSLPIQFHVAIGDDDIVMTENDPTLMRALFQHEPFRNVPIVLLHCYPYHRQAAYLANTYPNVYVDLGFTIPIVGAGSASVLAETLELTPINQLVASTDGHGQPEFQWFGVFLWRWALERVFQQYIDLNVIKVDEALSFAHAVLRGNALRIYPTAIG